MDAKTMLEIRRYASPPPLVHEVMVAALLLLGDNEELTRVSITGYEGRNLHGGAGGWLSGLKASVHGFQFSITLGSFTTF